MLFFTVACLHVCDGSVNLFQGGGAVGVRVFESRRQDQVRGRVKQGHFQQGFIDQGRFIREGIGQASGDRGGGMDRGRRVGPLAERVAGPRLTAAAPLARLPLPHL